MDTVFECSIFPFSKDIHENEPLHRVAEFLDAPVSGEADTFVMTVRTAKGKTNNVVKID